MKLTEDEVRIYSEVAFELGERMEKRYGVTISNAGVTHTGDFCVLSLERSDHVFCTIYLFHHMDRAHMFKWAIAYSSEQYKGQAAYLKIPVIKEGMNVLRKKGLINEGEVLDVIVTSSINSVSDEAKNVVSPYTGRFLTPDEAKKRITNLTGLEDRLDQKRPEFITSSRGTGFNQRRETVYKNETNESLLQIASLSHSGRSLEELGRLDPALAYELVERRLANEAVERKILTSARLPAKRKPTVEFIEAPPTQREQRLFEGDVAYYESQTPEQLEGIVNDTNPDKPDMSRLRLRNRELAIAIQLKGLAERFVRKGLMSEAPPENPYAL